MKAVENKEKGPFRNLFLHWKPGIQAMELGDGTVHDLGYLSVRKPGIQKQLHNDRFPEGSKKTDCDVLSAIQGGALCAYQPQQATARDGFSV